MLRNPTISLLIYLTITCLLISTVLGGEGRDFYKILEVKKNATPAEIKKAYRRLTL